MQSGRLSLGEPPLQPKAGGRGSRAAGDGELPAMRDGLS